jgi:hypothetical protein
MSSWVQLLSFVAPFTAHELTNRINGCRALKMKQVEKRIAALFHQPGSRLKLRLRLPISLYDSAIRYPEQLSLR